jgi:acyl carrier protein
MASYEEALRVLQTVLRDLNDQQIAPTPLDTDEASPLIGAGGVLDSLGLVSLLVAVEEAGSDAGWKPLALLEDTSLYGEGASYSVREVAELIRDRSAA